MEEVKAKLRDLCKNSGDFKQVELELERAGLNVESSLDGDYSTPLMIASFGNNWKLAIHFHVRMRAKLNTFDDFFGFTALHFCSLKSSVECAAALKLMGCDATLREKRGRDYLQLGEGGANFKQAVEALESNFRKCCDAITQHRAADLEVALACSHSLTHLVDENGNTLLIKAVAQLRFELAELLAKRGSDWFWANKEDQSALSILVDHFLAGKLSMKSATFMRNTLRDVKDKNANTLLHHLAMRRDARPSHLAVMIQLGLAEEAARNAENHTFVEVADNRGAQNFEREIEQAKRALRCEDWQNIESVMQRMIEAEQQSEPAEFLEILTKNSALAFFLRENGETWLHSQFVAKHYQLVEALMNVNADLINQLNAEALTPLQSAVKYSNIDGAQNLLFMSTEPNLRLNIQSMNMEMDELKKETNKRIETMQTKFEEKLQNCRDENIELQKTMQEKINVMQSSYEKKLQECRNEFEMKRSVAKLEADQTNEKMTQLIERVAQLEADQLEMARLVVEEPSQRAIQILKASLRKHPINSDVSISPKNSREDKELYEAAKFMRQIKQYKAELAELKEARQRNREKLKNQLHSAIIMEDDLIQSIERNEEKLSEIAPEMERLKNSISSNTQRIQALSKMEDALCDRHAIIKNFVSKSCAHRVCELCVKEKSVCGRCGKRIQSYIK